MLTKNINFKTKQMFSNKKNTENEFTLNVSIQANHVIDNMTMQSLEYQLKNINLTDYDKDTPDNSKKKK